MQSARFYKSCQMESMLWDETVIDTSTEDSSEVSKSGVIQFQAPFLKKKEEKIDDSKSIEERLKSYRDKLICLSNLSTLKFEDIFKCVKERQQGSDIRCLAVQCMCYAVENESTRKFVLKKMGDSFDEMLSESLDSDIRYSVAIAIGYLTNCTTEIRSKAMEILTEILNLSGSLYKFPVKKRSRTSREMDFITLRFRAIKSVSAAIRNGAPENDELNKVLEQYNLPIQSNSEFYLGISLEKGKKNPMQLPALCISKKQKTLEEIVRKMGVKYSDISLSCLPLFVTEGNQQEKIDDTLKTLFEFLRSSDPEYLIDLDDVKEKVRQRNLVICCLKWFVDNRRDLTEVSKQIFIEAECLFSKIKRMSKRIHIENDDLHELIDALPEVDTFHQEVLFKNIMDIVDKNEMENEYDYYPLVTQKLAEYLSYPNEDISMIAAKLLHHMYADTNSNKSFLCSTVPLLQKQFARIIDTLLLPKGTSFKRILLKTIYESLCYIRSNNGVPSLNSVLYHCIQYDELKSIVVQITKEIKHQGFCEDFLMNMLTVQDMESNCEAVTCRVSGEKKFFACQSHELKTDIVEIFEGTKQDLSINLWIQFFKFLWREKSKHIVDITSVWVKVQNKLMSDEVTAPMNSELFNIFKTLDTNCLNKYDNDSVHHVVRKKLEFMVTMLPTLLEGCSTDDLDVIKPLVGLALQMCNDQTKKSASDILIMLICEEMERVNVFETNYAVIRMIQKFKTRCKKFLKEQIRHQQFQTCDKNYPRSIKEVLDDCENKESLVFAELPNSVVVNRVTLDSIKTDTNKDDLKTNCVKILTKMWNFANDSNTGLGNIKNIYPTQYFSLLTMILKNDENGRICQVATGNGKSLIIAILAAYLGLHNRKVDIITSSKILAKRDMETFQSFFDIFELTYGINSNQSRQANGTKVCYNSDIVYGDIRDFQFDSLEQEFYFHRTRGDRKFPCVIIDEVDSILVDEVNCISMLSPNTPGWNYLNHLFAKIWFNEPASTIDTAEFIKDLPIPKHMMNYVEKKLDTWIENARYAKNECTLDVDYTILDGRIKIVDFKNTGMVYEDCRWTNGLHKFLELKHQMKLHQDGLPSNFCSNLEFIKRYDSNVFGFTGTVGSLHVKNFFSEIYNLDCVIIPDSHTSSFDEKDILICETCSWKESIIQSVCTYINTSERAVLIVANSISDANNIYEWVQENIEIRRNRLLLYTVNPRNHEETVELSVTVGDIIIATNLLGRGADINIDQNLKNKKGLHVIVTFFPRNSRVKKQIFGRTARQGNPGSAQIICKETEIPFRPLHIETYFGNNEAEKLMDDKEQEELDDYTRNDLPQDQLKHDLFRRYCEYRLCFMNKQRQNLFGIPGRLWKNLQRKKKLEFQLKYLDEQWAFWLNEQNYWIGDVNSMWLSFQNSLNENDVDGLFSNPFYLGGYASSLLISLEKWWCVGKCVGVWRKTTEKILSYYDRAIRLDEQLLFYCYYMTANALINLSTQTVFKKSPDSMNNVKSACKFLKESRKMLKTDEFYFAKELMDQQPLSSDLYRQFIQRMNVYDNIYENIQTSIETIQKSKKCIDIVFEVNDQDKLNHILCVVKETLKSSEVTMEIKWENKDIKTAKAMWKDGSTMKVFSTIEDNSKTICWRIYSNSKNTIIFTFSCFPAEESHEEFLNVTKDTVIILLNKYEDKSIVVEVIHCLTNDNDNEVGSFQSSLSNSFPCQLCIRDISVKDTIQILKKSVKVKEIGLNFHSLRQVNDTIFWSTRKEAKGVKKQFFKSESSGTISMKFSACNMTNAINLIPQNRLDITTTDEPITSKWEKISENILSKVRKINVEAKNSVFQLNGAEKIAVNVNFVKIPKTISLDFFSTYPSSPPTSENQSNPTQSTMIQILKDCSSKYCWADIKIDVTFTNLTSEQMRQVIYLNSEYLCDAMISMRRITRKHALSILKKSDIHTETFSTPKLVAIEQFLISSAAFDQLNEWKTNEIKYLFYLHERTPFRKATCTILGTIAIGEGLTAAGLLITGVGVPLAFYLLSEMTKDFYLMGKLTSSNFDWYSYFFKKTISLCQCAFRIDLVNPTSMVDSDKVNELVNKFLKNLSKQLTSVSIEYLKEKVTEHLKFKEQIILFEKTENEFLEFVTLLDKNWSPVLIDCSVDHEKRNLLLSKLLAKDKKSIDGYKSYVCHTLNCLNLLWKEAEVGSTSSTNSSEYEVFLIVLKQVLVEQFHYYLSLDTDNQPLASLNISYKTVKKIIDNLSRSDSTT